MTPAPDHGPGVRLLAELTGRTPEEIRSSPRALGGALKALGDEAVEAVVQLRSGDPRVRARAELRLQALRARIDEGPSPAERFRDRVGAALDEAIARLRADGPPAQDGDDGPSAP